MKKVKITLNSDEHLIAIFKLHYYDMISGFVISIVVGTVLYLTLQLFFDELTIIFIAILVISGMTWASMIEFRKTAIIVTNLRLIYIERGGLIYREITDIPLKQIQKISYEQINPFGHLLNFGTIKIQVAGGETSEIVVGNINNPSLVVDNISSLINSQSSNFPPIHKESQLNNVFSKLQEEISVLNYIFGLTVSAILLFFLIIYIKQAVPFSKDLFQNLIQDLQNLS